MEKFKMENREEDEKYSAFGKEKWALKDEETKLMKRRSEIIGKLPPADQEELGKIDLEWEELKKKKETLGV